MKESRSEIVGSARNDRIRKKMLDTKQSKSEIKVRWSEINEIASEIHEFCSAIHMFFFPKRKKTTNAAESSLENKK